MKTGSTMRSFSVAILVLALATIFCVSVSAGETSVTCKKWKKPVFDGVLSPGEWPEDTAKVFTDWQGVSNNKVKLFTSWDDEAVYFAVVTEDTSVLGRTTGQGAETYRDDDVEIFLETNMARAGARTNKVFQVMVGAAKGFNSLTGPGYDFSWRLKNFQFGVTVDGTMNKADDSDVGYVVEFAVPWKDMKLMAPLPGKKMGFLFVGFDPDKASDAMGSIFVASEKIKSSEIHIPSSWGTIEFK